MKENASIESSYSKKEKQLLYFLKANKNKVLNRCTIIEYIWNDSCLSSNSSLQTYISFLRKKMKQNKVKEKIKTVNGFGYMLCDFNEVD